MTRVRVRGIYATTLTRLLLDAGHDVVDASPPIQRRFDDVRAGGRADAEIDTSPDRQGASIVGDPEAVEEVRELLASVAVDALSWADPAPRGAIANGVVSDTRGGGAEVDLPAGATGYLPFDDVDGYVDVGDRLRVRVTEPSPPWDDFDAKLSTSIAVEGSLLALERGRSGVRADASDADATALARTTELLDAEPPEDWGVRWHRSAVDAGHETLGAALDDAAATAEEIEAALDDAPAPEDSAPQPIATPVATAWVWFGREARFALDDERRRVTTTLPGHHRIKAADRSASLGVDLAEAIERERAAGDADGRSAGDADERSADGTEERQDAAAADAFPFDAVATTLGPTEGDSVRLDHGKPDGRLYTLGSGDVTEYDPDGAITVRREIRGSGTYDGLETPREPGDAAITKLEEGRWWYPTVYRGEDGASKGTYVNVCTPVELFPDAVRYVDLHVDVVQPPGGDVRIVDEDELDAAVEAGHLSEALAEKATEVARSVRSAMAE